MLFSSEYVQCAKQRIHNKFRSLDVDDANVSVLYDKDFLVQSLNFWATTFGNASVQKSARSALQYCTQQNKDQLIETWNQQCTATRCPEMAIDVRTGVLGAAAWDALRASAVNALTDSIDATVYFTWISRDAARYADELLNALTRLEDDPQAIAEPVPWSVVWDFHLLPEHVYPNLIKSKMVTRPRGPRAVVIHGSLKQPEVFDPSPEQQQLFQAYVDAVGERTKKLLDLAGLTTQVTQLSKHLHPSNHSHWAHRLAVCARTHFFFPQLGVMREVTPGILFEDMDMVFSTAGVEEVKLNEVMPPRVQTPDEVRKQIRVYWTLLNQIPRATQRFKNLVSAALREANEKGIGKEGFKWPLDVAIERDHDELIKSEAKRPDGHGAKRQRIGDIPPPGVTQKAAAAAASTTRTTASDDLAFEHATALQKRFAAPSSSSSSEVTPMETTTAVVAQSRAALADDEETRMVVARPTTVALLSGASGDVPTVNGKTVTYRKWDRLRPIYDPKEEKPTLVRGIFSPFGGSPDDEPQFVTAIRGDETLDWSVTMYEDLLAIEDMDVMSVQPPSKNGGEPYPNARPPANPIDPSLKSHPLPDEKEWNPMLPDIPGDVEVFYKHPCPPQERHGRIPEWMRFRWTTDELTEDNTPSARMTPEENAKMAWKLVQVRRDILHRYNTYHRAFRKFLNVKAAAKAPGGRDTMLLASNIPEELAYVRERCKYAAYLRAYLGLNGNPQILNWGPFVQEFEYSDMYRAESMVEDALRDEMVVACHESGSRVARAVVHGRMQLRCTWDKITRLNERVDAIHATLKDVMTQEYSREEKMRQCARSEKELDEIYTQRFLLSTIVDVEIQRIIRARYILSSLHFGWSLSNRAFVESIAKKFAKEARKELKTFQDMLRDYYQPKMRKARTVVGKDGRVEVKPSEILRDKQGKPVPKYEEMLIEVPVSDPRAAEYKTHALQVRPTAQMNTTSALVLHSFSKQNVSTATRALMAREAIVSDPSLDGIPRSAPIPDQDPDVKLVKVRGRLPPGAFLAESVETEGSLLVKIRELLQRINIFDDINGLFEPAAPRVFHERDHTLTSMESAEGKDGFTNNEAFVEEEIGYVNAWLREQWGCYSRGDDISHEVNPDGFRVVPDPPPGRDIPVVNSAAAVDDMIYHRHLFALAEEHRIYMGSNDHKLVLYNRTESGGTALDPIDTIPPEERRLDERPHKHGGRLLHTTDERRILDQMDTANALYDWSERRLLRCAKSRVMARELLDDPWDFPVSTGLMRYLTRPGTLTNAILHHHKDGASLRMAEREAVDGTLRNEVLQVCRDLAPMVFRPTDASNALEAFKGIFVATLNPTMEVAGNIYRVEQLRLDHAQRLAASFEPQSPQRRAVWAKSGLNAAHFDMWERMCDGYLLAFQTACTTCAMYFKDGTTTDDVVQTWLQQFYERISTHINKWVRDMAQLLDEEDVISRLDTENVDLTHLAKLLYGNELLPVRSPIMRCESSRLGDRLRLARDRAVAFEQMYLHDRAMKAVISSSKREVVEAKAEASSSKREVVGPDKKKRARKPRQTRRELATVIERLETKEEEEARLQGKPPPPKTEEQIAEERAEAERQQILRERLELERRIRDGEELTEEQTRAASILFKWRQRRQQQQQRRNAVPVPTVLRVPDGRGGEVVIEDAYDSSDDDYVYDYGKE
jgi:hypothetical protein